MIDLLLFFVQKYYMIKQQSHDFIHSNHVQNKGRSYSFTITQLLYKINGNIINYNKLRMIVLVLFTMRRMR